MILRVQVKRETHAQYRYFNRKSNRNKKNEKRMNLVSNKKAETYSKNDALQKTFYQLLDKIHYKKHIRLVGGGFLFCLFVLFMRLV